MLTKIFGLQDRISRSFYVAVGMGLWALKYAVDAALVWMGAGFLLWPTNYVIPHFLFDIDKFSQIPSWLALLLAVWSIPFMWAGGSMTLRRAVDAGQSPFLCLGFFVPFVKFVLLLWMSVHPTSDSVDWKRGTVEISDGGRIRRAMKGILGGGLLMGVISIVLSIYALNEYSIYLFVATPFMMGGCISYVYNEGHPRPVGETLFVALLGLAVLATSLIFFGIEGAVCLLIALPLFVVPAILGGVIGRAVAVRTELRILDLQYGGD